MTTRMLIAIFALLAAAAAPAPAQSGPAGNTHPGKDIVAETSEGLEHPFGEAQMPTMDLSAKHAFAESVDLSALEGIAVFHNGRVKILDTLAREMVESMTGRSRHFDILTSEGGDPEKVRFDPMFTMLDTMIDPVYHINRPLIGIGYLPLRREIIAMAAADARDSGMDFNREGWLRMGMVSPRMVERYATPAFNKHANSEPFRAAVNTLDRSMSVFRNGVANLKVVAPASADEPWKHLGTLDADHPARVAAMDLARAWRAGDADDARVAAQTLASELKSIHPGIQAKASTGLEAIYNKINAFEWGLWIYLGSFVTLVLAFGTGRKALVFTGVGLLIGAIALHAVGFSLRCIIAERFAIQNQFESMTGISLFASLVGTGIMLIKKQWLFGAAAAGTGFLVLITATQTGIPGETIGREAAILNTSVLLKYHVTTVLTSYGLITLGFIVSLFYLGTHYANKYLRAEPVPGTGAGGGSAAAGDDGTLAAGALGIKDTGSKAGIARTLKDLDTAQMTILQLAFWTLGVGTLLGAWWADHSWGRWWAFDPKETWALVTWIVYLIVIHARFMQLKDRGLTTAWLSVLGFFVMLWTYFGVNLLLPGLHAYA